MTDFRRKKIRLQPWRYVGRQWYFLTLCTEGHVPRFNDPELVQFLVATLEQGAQAAGFVVDAYCFMPDHLHVLTSGVKEESDLLALVKGFKQRTSYWFRRRVQQQLWQRYFYDHVLWPGERWEAVANYIWMNPVRRGLCDRPEQWRHSGSMTVDWRRLMGLGLQPWVPPWKKGPT